MNSFKVLVLFFEVVEITKWTLPKSIVELASINLRLIIDDVCRMQEEAEFLSGGTSREF